MVVVVIVLLNRNMSRKLVVLILWQTISRAYRGQRCRIGPVTDEVALDQQPAADEVPLCPRGLLLYCQKLSQWISVYDVTELLNQSPGGSCCIDAACDVALELPLFFL